MEKLVKKIQTAVVPSTQRSAPVFNDEEKDLWLHGDAPGDSCFVVGNVTGDDGNTYNFLVHNGAMIPDGEGGFSVMVAMVSLTDKAGKQSVHLEQNFPYSEGRFAADRLEITTPVTSLTGSAKEMKLFAQLPDGRGSISAVLKNEGPALNNCASGMFPCFNDLVTFNHYGLPYLKAEGKLCFDGRDIAFKGDAWLDRQWGSGNLVQVMTENRVQTKWMDLNISNGYKVSLWDILMDGGIENSWATVLSPNGTHTVTYMKPLAESESDYWYSEATGNYYPTKYVVEFPDLNTKLNVSVYDGIPQQESVSSAGYDRYEAHSTFEGVFMGESVDGFCCVELVGDFTERGKAEAAPVPEQSAEYDPAISGVYKGMFKSPIGEKELIFAYNVENSTLTGSIELMGKRSEISKAVAVPGGFTHEFKMKVPVGSVNVAVKGSVTGNTLTAVLTTPMGSFEIKAERVQ